MTVSERARGFFPYGEGERYAGGLPMNIWLVCRLTGGTFLTRMDLHCSFRHEKYDAGDTRRWCVEIVLVNELWGKQQRQQGVKVVPHQAAAVTAAAPQAPCHGKGARATAGSSSLPDASGASPTTELLAHIADSADTSLPAHGSSCDTTHNSQHLGLPLQDAWVNGY